MPLVTLKHCLICYKERNSDNQQQNASSVHTLNKNGEICRRFCTLASRYLDLDPFHYHPIKTINTKRSYCFDQVCDDCVDMLSSFCEIYHQVEYLQLQLSWRAHEISQVMKRADKDEENQDSALRKSLEENLADKGWNMEEIDDFRTDFVDSIAKKRAEEYPNLPVKREGRNLPAKKEERNLPGKKEEPEPDEDPDFEVVKVKKSSVKRTASQKTTKQRPTSSASCDIKCPPGETRKRLESEQRKTEDMSKKPKISLRNKKSTTANTSSEYDMAVENCERGHTSTEYLTNNECSSSTVKKSAPSDVIILNDNNTDIVNSTDILKDFSCKYQDNLLNNRVGGTDTTDADDHLLTWVMDFNNEAETMSLAHKPEANGIASSKSNDHYNGFHKQFNYLQYACPFPHCGKKFNTMTRMMVHQKATGHNLNAVITITSK